ncbi:MAG: DUF1444 domain-containing protein [Roseiflexus castenholzii]|uniref:DUF1444 family protein n=1 Tax=Roseiflexus castenholzii TaxID=120962 RepID=UPI000CC7FBE6|nr:MAG: DUF1444 domain-containing protein [Roseiflexus castenholzii]
MRNGDTPLMEADQFAAYIERRLSLYDDVLEVRERRGSSLRVHARGHEVTITLDRFYRAYARDPAQLDAIVQTMVSMLTRDIPARDRGDFAVLRERLFPMLKPIGLLAFVRDRRLPMLVYRPFLADLIITYVVDEPQSVAYINEQHLDQWGVSERDIHEAALRNLRRRTDERVPYAMIGEDDQRLFIFNSNDGYDATRLLLTDILADWAQRVCGQLVIGIPNRDFLIALGDENPDILRSVAAQIQIDAVQRDYGLTDRLFTLVGGQIREYEMA